VTELEERSLWYTVEPVFMVFLNKHGLLKNGSPHLKAKIKKNQAIVTKTLETIVFFFVPEDRVLRDRQRPGRLNRNFCVDIRRKMKENCSSQVSKGGRIWIVIRKRTWKDATVPMNPAPEKGFAANALPITWT